MDSRKEISNKKQPAYIYEGGKRYKVYQDDENAPLPVVADLLVPYEAYFIFGCRFWWL